MDILSLFDLDVFYETPRGEVCQKIIQQKIYQFTSKLLPPSTFLGVGYVFPYLETLKFSQETWAGKKLLLVPEAADIFSWTSRGFSSVDLKTSHLWGLPDRSVDFILMMHSLEHNNHPPSFLREAWRVLKNDGLLLGLVPNRRGLWARAETTPFGHGHPYTQAQLIALFEEGCFIPLEVDGCLYTPPFTSSFLLSLAPFCEKIGQGGGKEIGGTFLILATKNLYADIPLKKKTWIKYMPLLNKN